MEALPAAWVVAELAVVTVVRSASGAVVDAVVTAAAGVVLGTTEPAAGAGGRGAGAGTGAGASGCTGAAVVGVVCPVASSKA